MRLTSATIAASILSLAGCSSFSATVVKANDDAGISTGGKPSNGGMTSSGDTSTARSSLGGSSEQTNSTAGGTSAVGGSSNTMGGGTSIVVGGSTTTGGAPLSGGTSANATATSSGGTNAPGGGTSAGGTTSTAGGSSPGGTAATSASTTTGGANACTKDADCTNPDPVNCSYTCVNPGASGTCKPAALKSPTQCATTACDDKPISGFWDANGKPHIAIAWTETDGTATIRMQQLKLDGTPDGAAVPYKLPTLQQESSLISANAQGSRVGFLWYGIQGFSSAAGSRDIQFATTDLSGSSSTPATIDGSQGGLGTVKFVWLQLTPAGAWLALSAYGQLGASWNVASGSTIAAWASFSALTYNEELAASAVGSTLMLTGADCSSVSGCTQKFVVQRYSVASLAAIGTPITLSTNIQSASPAVGPLQGSMAIIWTETQSPGLLFRTLMKEDGTFALAIGTVQSAIQPKAVVQSVDGGALLIGTIAVGNPTTYQVAGQRLDANLGLVGSPLPVADAEDSDATSFETRLSSDGKQVLITYRQAGAKFRLLSTNSCN